VASTAFTSLRPAARRRALPTELIGMWTRTTASGGTFYEFTSDGVYHLMSRLQQPRSAGLDSFEYWEQGAVDVHATAPMLTLEPFRADATLTDPDNPHANYVDRPRKFSPRTMGFALSDGSRTLTLTPPGEPGRSTRGSDTGAGPRNASVHGRGSGVRWVRCPATGAPVDDRNTS
jgi:hypothetical protein